MRTAALSAIALLAAASAGAQFTQYTAPGSLGVEQIPTQERLQDAMDDARYHLGPLRFGPWVALKDVGYVDNVFGTETNQKSDLTATLGAGVLAYLPIGHRMTLGMYALPEYVWWRDLTGFRGWNGAAGAGLFGYFNRMTVEIQAGVTREQSYASSELEVPVNLEDQPLSALLEIEVLGKLSVFGRGGVDRWRYNTRGLSPDLIAELTPLERDESHVGGGVRYHFSKTASLGVGVEQYTTDFIHEENRRSNSGLAPIAELRGEAGHVSVVANAVFLDLKPDAQSGFVAYRRTNGRFQVGFRPAGQLEVWLYGGRSLAYSVASEYSYYVDERTGIAIQSPIGWRATGRVFYESGKDGYIAESTGSFARTDDLNAYGVAADVRLGRRATLVVGADRTNYTSGLGVYDRSVTRVRTSLQLSGGKGKWW